MHFNPTLPFQLVLIIGGVLITLTVALYWFAAARLSLAKRMVLLGLRLVASIAVVFLLLEPSKVEEIPKPQHNRAVLIGVDTSGSMTQEDEGGTTRFEAARKVLRDNGFLSGSASEAADIRLFQFDSDARATTVEGFASLAAEGDTTQFHKSISSMAESVTNADIEAMVLLSDGHDFQLESVTRTADLARRKRFPIFAVPFGNTGKVRDIAVRIDNYQPYAYINQETRISARLRLIGCEYESLNVQLLRNGKLVSNQNLSVGEEPEVPVAFSVKEPTPGQFQYEVKVTPRGEESDLNNNNAFTFLNVIDEKIRVLILEGSPYWDTTFLQRSLYRNDKIELDAILSFAEQRQRRVRNDSIRGQLNDPVSPEDYNQYDAIVLGRSVDRLLEVDNLRENLIKYVDEFGGTLIFARGRALHDDNDALSDLEPVLYDSVGNSEVTMEISSDGRGLAAFQLLHSQLRTADSLPPLIAARRTVETKPLSATLAEVQDSRTGETMPAVIHRRFGKGQVLNINVAGLWKWSFNSKSENDNNLFDRFWDQLLVWLLSQSDVIPNQDYSFRANKVNLLLGESIDFRLAVRDRESLLGLKPMRINREGKLVGEINWSLDENEGNAAICQYLPEVAGRYEARVRLPNGEEIGQKFMVFEERAELTEVATDLAYLTRLCQSTGGDVLDRNNLQQLLRTIAKLKREQQDDTAETRLIPIWDRFSVFLVVLLFFAADWMLRRRWGLT